MGLLNSLEAEIEKLNPANLVSEIEEVKEKINAYESRISTMEKSLGALVSVVQQAVPVIEAAFPQATPEITALLSALKGLTVAAATSAAP